MHDSTPIDAIQDLTTGKGAPDIEMLVAPLFVLNNGVMVPSNHGITFVSAVDPRPRVDNVTRHVSQSTIALQPRSTGSITLRSAHPWDSPLIDPKCVFNIPDCQVHHFKQLPCLSFLSSLSSQLRRG